MTSEEPMVKRVVKEEVEKIRPTIDVILLDDIARGIQQILTHLRETTPEGKDVPLPEKTVTGTQTINLIREYPYRPLRSIDFFNKGPDTTYYRINEEEKEIPIENRESMTVERPRPTIEYVTLRVDAGNTATLKLVGHY